MKLTNWARAFGIAAGIAILAGCSANGSTPSLGGSSLAPQSAHGGHSFQDMNKRFAMTNVAGKGVPATRHPLTHSWMHKPPKGTTGTLWATDLEYGSVDVIAYPSGTLTGQVAGFSYPYGDCSDSQGNVYVADFSNEAGYEIQAGTTSIINSWSTGGEAIGCSVSKSGDVSFTNFYPGGVVVFPGGGPTGTTYSGPGYDWPAGYDKNGNLFVECNYVSPCSSPHLAELVSGSWQFLNFDQSIAFPAAVQGGAPDIGVADQNYNFADTTAIYWTSISGSNAHAVRTYNMEGSGCSTYMDDSSSWGSLAKQHANGVQIKKVKGVAAANLWCFPSPINIYGKKGGTPASTISVLTYQYDYGVTFTTP